MKPPIKCPLCGQWITELHWLVFHFYDYHRHVYWVLVRARVADGYEAATSAWLETIDADLFDELIVLAQLSR